MSGPVATPRPATPPQMPIASGRRASGTDPASSVSESGMIAGGAEALQCARGDELAGVGG